MKLHKNKFYIEFKPKYKKGDYIRWKRELIDIDFEVANEIYIINDVCYEYYHHHQHKHYYYNIQLLYSELIGTLSGDIDCLLLEENTEKILN